MGDAFLYNVNLNYPEYSADEICNNPAKPHERTSTVITGLQCLHCGGLQVHRSNLRVRSVARGVRLVHMHVLMS